MAGRSCAAGTPAQVRAAPRSFTGQALGAYEQALSPAAGAPLLAAVAAPSAPEAAAGRGRHAIVIHNAREHNLKNIDVEIPRDRFTVITGVSGSGKSTLAFDILFNEGQRRYLESLNAYARQFVQPAARPDVDAIFGIPPTVAIEQRTSRGGRKSTVATLTEIYHFLRLLYVKLGTQYCPDCSVAIEPQSPASIAARLLRDYKGKRITLLAPLVIARKGYYTDLAKWAAKKGFRSLRVDGGAAADGPLATPVALPRAHHRAAGGRGGREREERGGAARRSRPRARLRQGAGARARAQGGARHGVLHQARLSGLRQEFRGTGSAAVLLQLQARLVRGLLRHGGGDAGLR